MKNLPPYFDKLLSKVEKISEDSLDSIYCPIPDKRGFPLVWICSRNKLIQVGESNCQFYTYPPLESFWQKWPDQLCQFVPLCLPPQKDCYKVSPSYFTTIQTFLRFFSIFQDILTKCKVSPSYFTTYQTFLRFFL